MPQMQWTYVADSGVQYRVRLYHGPASGHVLIAINGKVSIVDFFVKETKSWSLLVEDELFIVEAIKGTRGWSYGFTIDETADTDRNRIRRKTENRQDWIIGTVAVLALGLLIWGGITFSRWQNDKIAEKVLPRLAESGTATWGYLGKKEGGPPVWYYHAGKRVYTLPMEEWNPAQASLVMGDDIRVWYHPAKPEIARTDYRIPGLKRSIRLLTLWMEKEMGHREWPSGIKECLEYHLTGRSHAILNPDLPWHQSGFDTEKMLGDTIPGWKALVQLCEEKPSAK